MSNLLHEMLCFRGHEISVNYYYYYYLSVNYFLGKSGYLIIKNHNDDTKYVN